MAWLTRAAVDAYFASTNFNAEWGALADSEKDTLIGTATVTLESIPFLNEDPSRTADRYTDQTTLPRGLHIAFCELCLWFNGRNARARPDGSGLINYFRLLPQVVQNGLAPFVDFTVSNSRQREFAGALSYDGATPSSEGGGTGGAPTDLVNAALVGTDIRFTRRNASTFDIDLPTSVAGGDPYHYFEQHKDINISQSSGDPARVLSSGDGLNIPFLAKTTHSQAVLAGRNFTTDPEGFVNLHFAGAGVVRADISFVTTHHFSEVDSTVPDLTTSSRTEQQEVVLGEANSVNLRAHGSNVVVTPQSTGGSLAGRAVPISIVINVKLYDNADARVAGTVWYSSSKAGITFWQLANVGGGGSGSGITPAQIARLLPEPAIIGTVAIRGVSAWQTAQLGHNWTGEASTNPGYFTGQTFKYNGNVYWVEAAIPPGTAFANITSGSITNLTESGGLTPEQANAIAANTAKVGITSQQAAAIVANSAKVGITPQQASAIVANSAKVGITAAQASEIAANTLKQGLFSVPAAAYLGEWETEDTASPAAGQVGYENGYFLNETPETAGGAGATISLAVNDAFTVRWDNMTFGGVITRVGKSGGVIDFDANWTGGNAPLFGGSSGKAKFFRGANNTTETEFGVYTDGATIRGAGNAADPLVVIGGGGGGGTAGSSELIGTFTFPSSGNGALTFQAGKSIGTYDMYLFSARPGTAGLRRTQIIDGAKLRSQGTVGLALHNGGSDSVAIFWSSGNLISHRSGSTSWSDGELYGITFGSGGGSGGGGLTPSQIAAIAANTAKVGITSQQAAAIVANSAKVGVVAGGTAGQIYAKNAANDGYEWIDAPSGGGGGGVVVDRIFSTKTNITSRGSFNSFNAGQLLNLPSGKSFAGKSLITFNFGFTAGGQDPIHPLTIDGAEFRASNAANPIALRGSDQTTSGYTWGVWFVSNTSFRVAMVGGSGFIDSIDAYTQGSSGGGGGVTYTAGAGINISDSNVISSTVTGITSQQASAIVANSAKVGITPQQASAIVANTAKVGITPQQASEITANTAKISAANSDLTGAAAISTGLRFTRRSGDTFDITISGGGGGTNATSILGVALPALPT